MCGTCHVGGVDFFVHPSRGEVVQGLNIVSECISVSQVIDALVEKGEIFTCSGGVVALGLDIPQPLS